MQTDETRFLFAYDRWATGRVLAVLGLESAVWERAHLVDELLSSAATCGGSESGSSPADD
jgi:hypothetical protein